MSEPRTIGEFAGKLYEEYCKAVGGKAFNGDPLPDWKTFSTDPSKQKQSNAWIVVAKTAVADFEQAMQETVSST